MVSRFGDAEAPKLCALRLFLVHHVFDCGGADAITVVGVTHFLRVISESLFDFAGRDYDADVGIIAVDASGTPVAMHRTRDMPHAFFAGEGEVVSRMRV